MDFCRVPFKRASPHRARIQQLCTEAVAAKTLADVDRILPELRSALEDHVRLAKESLETQIATITSLEAASQTAKGLSKE
jgi:hypothetical protein